jgi:hypothetical protein
MIRNWKSLKLQEYRQSIHGQREAKNFLKRPSAKRVGELLNFSRNQLRMSELLTGHCSLKGHLI